jgi:hypothetical protein
MRTGSPPPPSWSTTGQILPGDEPRLLTGVAAGQVLFWLLNDGSRLASGRLTRMSTAAH